jgi:multicomponent Na+:H+ antiporter subunit D
MMTSSLSPFLIFYIGAVLTYLTRGTLRTAITLLIPVVGAWNLWMLSGLQVDVTYSIFDYTLTLLRMDKLSLIFGILFHLAAFLGFIFSAHVRDTSETTASMIYAGSALGAVFAGDMITLFLFWEMLALSSVFLILARRTARARAAAMRYLLIQVLSGVILLAGVLLRIHETGSIEFNYIGIDSLSGWIILFAIGIKCAFPFLHNWLTDAYPEATPTGTVFLSAFTTKVAVYSLARSFPGVELLVYIGGTMAMFPIFFAVIENDLRRVLGYSLINQVGFMVVGIGLGSELAINGAISHAFNDVIFKGLLFMSMGAVLYRTGKMNGSELGNLYKSMPWTAGFCIVGAASISAFPLFSGFVSKSMVMVAALEEGHDMIWLALLFASAGVFHHAGIKIPFFAFFAHESGIRCKEAPKNMLLAMGLAAVICIFNGSYPWLLYDLLPFPVDYAPYTAAHVLSQTQLLFYSALAFCLLKLTGLYPPELPGINIDAEWTYRKLMPKAALGLLKVFAPLNTAVRQGVVGRIWQLFSDIEKLQNSDGILARSQQAGNMVLWVIVVLGAYLVFYLFG